MPDVERGSTPERTAERGDAKQLFGHVRCWDKDGNEIPLEFPDDPDWVVSGIATGENHVSISAEDLPLAEEVTDEDDDDDSR